MNKILVYLFVFGTTFGLLAQSFNFLDIEKTGAAEFIRKHPSYNGKGVVILVLDTGVDMGTPGLTSLPDGSPKVIDAQDFSGEGDVALEKATTGTDQEGRYLQNEDGFRLHGLDRLPETPQDSLYYIGVLDEERFKNSVIPDINNNGRQDDRFGVAVFKGSEGWQAYVDLDGDGDIGDEKPLWNYKEKLQAFHFRSSDGKESRPLATFALNIFPDEKRVNFHYDGSSHGTHVAGIAAGYRIDGQEGYNGMAPGAKVISLKIGDCRLAGGATTTGSMLKAYEYGIEFAKHYDGPVVFNMSFGIGSEIEGLADMDLMLNDFLEENENLVFCISAGNEGPGISTVGLPTAASRVLSVGAMNTARTARDLYGANVNRDLIFVFSSRGGEINKPDIIAPGGASSTVPGFSTRDVKWGTSMASPAATGSVALIMSAAYQQDPPLPIVGALIKRAVKNAAQPLPGYLPLDQGGGVINVPRAFEYYKYYIKNKEQDKVLDYDISTVSPIYPEEEGPAAYWRFGDYFPQKNDKQTFFVNPVFPNKLSDREKHDFYRAFTLKSTAPWIKLNKTMTYIKGNGPAKIEVYFDPAKMKGPGLYNGKVIAYRKGGVFSGTNNRDKEFELMCTVVRPIIFNEGNHYAWRSGTVKLKKGEVRRFFFDIPLKASAASLKFSVPEGKYANVRAYLFDPAGRESAHFVWLSSKRRPEQLVRLKSGELQPGTWELDLYADFRNEEDSYARVDVAFSGLQTSPRVISGLYYENGDTPHGEITVLNRFDRKMDCTLGGKIYGIRKTEEIQDNSERYEYPFSVGDDYEKVEFELEMEPDVFNMFTDFAVNIKDYDGKVLKADGFTYRKLKMTFVPEKSGDYVLELVPGFAAKEAREWTLNLTASYYRFKTISVQGARESFYPRIRKTINFHLSGELPVAPEGYRLFGELWLDSRDAYRFRNVVPILLRTSVQ